MRSWGIGFVGRGRIMRCACERGCLISVVGLMDVERLRLGK